MAAAPVIDPALGGMPLSLPSLVEVRQILRMSIAAVLAWEAGALLGAPHPTFAVLAVLFSLQGNPAGSLRTAGQRLLGVVVGVLVGMVAIRGPGLSAPTAGLVILIALLAGSVPRLGGRPNVQVAVSALLLLTGGGGWSYGVTRLWETALGGMVAVLVSALLWPVNPVHEAAEELRRLARMLAQDLRSVSGLFTLDPRRASARLEVVRVRTGEVERLWSDFPDTVATLRWNPWRDRAAIARTRSRLALLAVLYRHARSLTRIGADFAAAPTGQPPAAGPLQAALDPLAEAAAELSEPTGRLAAPRASEVGPRVDRLVQSGGDPQVVGALAAEIGHIAADLHRLLDHEAGEG